jgi:hypothetical protein
LEVGQNSILRLSAKNENRLKHGRIGNPKKTDPQEEFIIVHTLGVEITRKTGKSLKEIPLIRPLTATYIQKLIVHVMENLAQALRVREKMTLKSTVIRFWRRIQIPATNPIILI